MKITSVTLPNALTDKIDQVAGRAGLSRSWVVGYLLRDPTAANRLQALEQIAQIELSQHETIDMSEKSGVQVERELTSMRRAPTPTAPLPLETSRPAPSLGRMPSKKIASR